MSNFQSVSEMFRLVANEPTGAIMPGIWKRRGSEMTLQLKLFTVQ